MHLMKVMKIWGKTNKQTEINKFRKHIQNIFWKTNKST